jgi:hypothetical protein
MPASVQFPLWRYGLGMFFATFWNRLQVMWSYYVCHRTGYLRDGG